MKVKTLPKERAEERLFRGLDELGGTKGLAVRTGGRLARNTAATKKPTGSLKEGNSVSRGMVGGAAGRVAGNNNGPSPEHTRVLEELMHYFIDIPKGSCAVCILLTLRRLHSNSECVQRNEMPGF